jgi:hypothetical protein
VTPAKERLRHFRRGKTTIGKASRTPREVAKYFQFQVEPWDCDPAQIHNCLFELRRRHGPAVPDLSVGEVRRLIPAALEGNRHLRAVANLRRRLNPQGYTARAVFGSMESSWTTVIRILRDEEASFPILGVSPDYWSEVSSRPKSTASLGHSLLLLRATDDEAFVFDSYLGHLARAGQLKNALGPSVRPENAIVGVPLTRFLVYWSNAHTPRYCFWVEKIKSEKAAGQRTLSQSWERT